MKYIKANADLDIKIIEERYHNELLNCRLKGCYNESLLLLILTIGFIYEWKKGALDWE